MGINVGDEIEIVGIRDTKKTTCTGVEMFRKLLDRGEAGDNIGALLRGIDREGVERGQVLCKPGSQDNNQRKLGNNDRGRATKSKRGKKKQTRNRAKTEPV